MILAALASMGAVLLTKNNDDKGRIRRSENRIFYVIVHSFDFHQLALRGRGLGRVEVEVGEEMHGAPYVRRIVTVISILLLKLSK